MYLKSALRSVYLASDAHRKEVDSAKEKVDKSNLALENLLYRQAYLRREIRTCKDLSTPNLSAIEDEIKDELEEKLGAIEFREDLSSFHERSMTLLQKEMDQRESMQSILQSRKQKQQQSIEKLDKKRKFLEELPTRVAFVKAATGDLQNQFTLAMQDSSQLSTIA